LAEIESLETMLADEKDKNDELRVELGENRIILSDAEQ